MKHSSSGGIETSAMPWAGVENERHSRLHSSVRRACSMPVAAVGAQNAQLVRPAGFDPVQMRVRQSRPGWKAGDLIVVQVGS